MEEFIRFSDYKRPFIPASESTVSLKREPAQRPIHTSATFPPTAVTLLQNDELVAVVDSLAGFDPDGTNHRVAG